MPKQDQDYSFVSRVLHRLALNKVTAEVWFDLEKSIHGRNLPEDPGQHVFVSGLARAGTTVLMRLLHDTGDFRSLTYRDMPFILAPNFWNSISNRSRKKGEVAERAHGDGLDHGFDSPEALEEVFWRVFSGDQYIRDDHLRPASVDPELSKEFRTWVSLVLKQGNASRYLSKNNNNILRLDSIANAFPKAHIVVPFRDPLQHARSLWEQHLRFLEVHKEDPFSRSYMGWLAHHEFGADHRPFKFSQSSELVGDPSEMNYWVSLWIHVHRSLLDHLPDQALVVSYEKVCLEPKEYWPRVCRSLGVPTCSTDMLRSPKITPIEGVDRALEESAYEVHAKLLEET